MRRRTLRRPAWQHGVGLLQFPTRPTPRPDRNVSPASAARLRLGPMDTHAPYVAAENRYDTMEYRRCGRSGLRLPAVSLGLWQNFGDAVALERQRDIILAA